MLSSARQMSCICRGWLNEEPFDTITVRYVACCHRHLATVKALQPQRVDAALWIMDAHKWDKKLAIITQKRNICLFYAKQFVNNLVHSRHTRGQFRSKA